MVDLSAMYAARDPWEAWDRFYWDAWDRLEWVCPYHIVMVTFFIPHARGQTTLAQKTLVERAEKVEKASALARLVGIERAKKAHLRGVDLCDRLTNLWRSVSEISKDKSICQWGPDCSLRLQPCSRRLKRLLCEDVNRRQL